MTEKTQSLSDLTNKAVPEEGWLTGKRGLKNKINLGFCAVVGLGLAGLSQVEFTERPDDLAHGAFLQEDFAEAIQMAVDTPNSRHYFLPANLTEAGELLAEHEQSQTDIQRDYVDGDHGIVLAGRDIENASLLTEARQIFRQGLDSSGSAEIIVGGIRCDTTDSENIYSCRLTRAEIGGFDDPRGGLGACERITDHFTVTANINGAIEYLRTRGPGHSSTINFETTERSLEENLGRGLMAYVTGDLAFYGAQTHPLERAAFERFSACLNGQQGPI